MGGAIVTDWIPSKDEFWKADGVCADPKINRDVADKFFSYNPSEMMEAKKLCFSCPVRKDCVKWALENNQIWGIWGGKDEQEIRRTLSVNADGAEIRRDRYPQCLYCGARTAKLNAVVAENPDGGRWTTVRLVECSDCGFVWRSRTSANAVNAYKASVEEKKSKKEEEETKDTKRSSKSE